jgi:uncharacterized protein YrzB (UPF0473 family)
MQKEMIAIIDENGDVDEFFPINSVYDEIFRIRDVNYKKSKVFVVEITVKSELKD